MEKVGESPTRRFLTLRMPRATPTLVVLVVSGLILRLIVAPFTSHPYDFAVWASTMERFYNLSLSPLYYWKFGSFLNVVFLLAYALYLAMLPLVQGQNVLLLHLVLKLPFIMADMGIAIVLYTLALGRGASTRSATILMSLWLFNPFAVFVSAIHGETDALPAFFVMLSLYLLQNRKFLSSFVSLLIGGMFKYYPLLIVPAFLIFSWKVTNIRTKIIGFAAFLSIVTLNYAATMLDPLARANFLSVLSFNAFANSQSTPWSLWIVPIFFGLDLSQMAASITPIWAGSYFLFLAGFACYSRGTKRILSELDISKAYLAITIIFVAFAPVANPQFLIWILPLMFYFSFLTTKSSGYVLATLLWASDLASLFTFVSPLVYVLDAVPNVFALDIVWPYANNTLSLLYRSLYGLLLVSTLVLVVKWKVPSRKMKRSDNKQTLMRPRADGTPRSGSRFTLATVTSANLLVIGLLLYLSFYPALVPSYFQNTPSNPLALYRVNEIPYFPTTTTVSHSGDLAMIDSQVRVDLATWMQRSDPAYYNSSLVIRMTDGVPESLLVDHERADNASLLSSNSRVDQLFFLEKDTLGAKFVLLISEPRNYTNSQLKYLRFDLYDSAGALVQSRTADTVQRDNVAKGWYFYTFTITNLLPRGTSRLSSLVENNTVFWYWNGGDPETGVDMRYVNGQPTGVNNWVKVYSIPSIETKVNGVVLGHVITSEGGDFSLHFDGHQVLFTENNVHLTAADGTIEHLQMIFLQVQLNIRPLNPWWMTNLGIVYVLAVTGVLAFAFATLLFVSLLSRKTLKNGSFHDTSTTPPDNVVRSSST